MNTASRKGAHGERLAQDYLIRQGYAILATNWSAPCGEIDIIARRSGLYVFVEVKTRYSQSTETALAGISKRKHEKIIKTVYQYLHDCALDEEVEWRVDVIAIALQRSQPPRIDHVENAFDW